jgi:hypothetical protein
MNEDWPTKPGAQMERESTTMGWKTIFPNAVNELTEHGVLESASASSKPIAQLMQRVAPVLEYFPVTQSSHFVQSALSWS